MKTMEKEENDQRSGTGNTSSSSDYTAATRRETVASDKCGGVARGPKKGEAIATRPV